MFSNNVWQHSTQDTIRKVFPKTLSCPVRSKGSRDKVMIKTDPPELIFHVEAEIYGPPGTYFSEM